jgi:hypothetical protein
MYNFEQDEAFLKLSVPMRKLAFTLQKISDNFLQYSLEKIKEGAIHAEPVKKRRQKSEENSRSSISDPSLVFNGQYGESEQRATILKRTE